MPKHLLLFTAFIMNLICYSQSKNFIDQPYIEVSGSADTLVTPNQIFIKIIVSEKDTRNKVSIEELENKMISAFKAIGVNTETNLVLSDFISNYRFYLLKQKDIIKTKQYLLNVSDAMTASKIFLLLEDLEISNVSIEKVEHTEIENIKNICRTRAIENARNKAIALTKPLFQTIGQAINISDNETYVDGQLQGKVAGITIRGIRSFSNDKYEAPQIEFEKIKVRQTVNSKFILK